MANHNQRAAVKTPSGSAMYHYEGAIPPSQMMKEYGQINPEFPDRLIKMAEKEATHRQDLENKLTNKAWHNEILKNFSGLFSVALICFTGYLFMKDGYSEYGASIIKTVVVALSAVFVIRQVTAKK
jgi:uncharacterized membrane protein